MDEEKKDELTPEQQKPPYTPASKTKRVIAWIGVILMVLLVIMYSYSIATGAFLQW